MDFSLSPELLELERSVSAFARRQFQHGPGLADDHANAEPFYRAAWDACCRFGIQGMPVAESYGGSAASLLECVVALRALARHCPHPGLLFALCCHLGACALPIQNLGSDAQRARYLPGAGAGAIIGSTGPIRSTSVSPDVGRRLSARPADDGFSLNGAVAMMCNASQANLFLMFARTEGTTDGTTGGPVTAFLVPRDTPGLRVGDTVRTMALPGAAMAEVVCDDCRLPESAILGRIHDGRQVERALLIWQVTVLLACHLGRMDQQLATCVTYGRTRRQFGKPIGEFQAVAHQIADMKMRIELGSLIVHKMAWAGDQGQDALVDVAVGKLFVSASYVASSRSAIQLHGGYGIMRDSGLDLELRDALGGQMYFGGSTLPRDVLAHALLGLDDDPLA